MYQLQPEDRAGQPSSGSKDTWVASQSAVGLTLAHGFLFWKPTALLLTYLLLFALTPPTCPCHQTSTHPHTPTKHHGS